MFYPPTPSSYTVQRDKNVEANRIVYQHADLQESPYFRQAAEVSTVHWVSPRKGSQLPIVWVPRPPPIGQEERIVILHCHGNASDIGIMLGHLSEMADVLKVEVVGVEYSGYGVAGGKLHSSHIGGDMEAAYMFLLESGVQPSQIIAYGQSVGSAPAVRLASRHRIGGAVLHSPLASALQVIDPRPDACCRPSCVLCCIDAFPNDRNMSSIRCPVLIMHGERDDIVPLHNAQKLQKRCKEAYQMQPYIHPEAGHNDLIEVDKKTYFDRLSTFVEHIRERLSGCTAENRMLTRPCQQEMMNSASAPGATWAHSPQTRRGSPSHSGAVMPAPEPQAGPTDGRYERLRRGDLVGGVIGTGSARELH